MTADTTTTWTCDRCSTTEVCPQRDQPAAWVAFMTWTPPLMNPNESNERRLHLCPDCHDLLERLLDPCVMGQPEALLRTEPIGDVR